MIEHLATVTAHGTFSRSATYTPPGGGPVDVEVVMHFGVESPDPMTGQIDEDDYADFLTGEVIPTKGGILSEVEGHEGKSWRLGHRDSGDSELVRYRIIEE